jgi:hypothetical protein
MSKFPSLCVDGFYDDPFVVYEYAKQVRSLAQQSPVIPVARTKNLQFINPQFHHTFCRRMLSLYFSEEPTTNFKITTFFQYMNNVEGEGTENCGGIHQDDSHCVLAGVVYLCPESNVKSGTSIFSNPTNRTEGFSHALRQSNPEEYRKQKAEFEADYIESLNVGNVFNRLIAFDAQQWHRANNFHIPGLEDRIAQVFFVYETGYDKYPLDRYKTYPIVGL